MSTLAQLNNFKVNVEKIDRLYYVYRQNHVYEDGTVYEEYIMFDLLCRMEYKGVLYYVELWAICRYSFNNGMIYLSREANEFAQVVGRKRRFYENKETIYASLREDGILFEEIEYDDNKIPTLKYLCHDAVYENERILQNNYYTSLLPRVLSKSVKEFVKIKRAKKFYDIEKCNWIKKILDEVKLQTL